MPNTTALARILALKAVFRLCYTRPTLKLESHGVNGGIDPYSSPHEQNIIKPLQVAPVEPYRPSSLGGPW